ncbi:MAG: hypothetical protein R6V12_11890 [Candidatus Hydrogenedentota bacterium]
MNEYPDHRTQKKAIDDLTDHFVAAISRVSTRWRKPTGVQTMTKKPLKYTDVRDAYDFVSFGEAGMHEAWMCLETGKSYWHTDFGDNMEPLPDDIDDSDKYIMLPDKRDLDLGNRLVMRFVREHMPEHSGRVQDFFGKRGAYARFKDLLEREDMLQQWYDYEEAATDKALREWCAENGIELVD